MHKLAAAATGYSDDQPQEVLLDAVAAAGAQRCCTGADTSGERIRDEKLGQKIKHTHTAIADECIAIHYLRFLFCALSLDVVQPLFWALVSHLAQQQCVFVPRVHPLIVYVCIYLIALNLPYSRRAIKMSLAGQRPPPATNTMRTFVISRLGDRPHHACDALISHSQLRHCHHKPIHKIHPDGDTYQFIFNFNGCYSSQCSWCIIVVMEAN